ncbi:glycoside hydrolase family 52 protein [Opitutae bacterium]|nr:glycoside hydrolase family 52 protein [Opitutae bacterium]
MRTTNSFHAHHSPMGSHSSFTVGMFGANGGMALEKGSPADQSIFLGYRSESGLTKLFPFYENLVNDAERFSQDDSKEEAKTIEFSESEIKRNYKWATDEFIAPGISFRIKTPFFSIPDPESASEESLKKASCPASFIEISVSNDSDENWDGFFAIQGSTPWTPLSSRDGNLKGMMSRDEMGFASDDESLSEFIDFGIEQALAGTHKTPNFLLGPIGGISFKVEAGTQKTVRIALGYFRDGDVVFNRSASYWYTQYFDSIESVFSYALKHYNDFSDIVQKADNDLLSYGLSEDQQFLIAHATRSYYGSTEWLVEDGKPLWIVNEGEYLMINTLDLTIDMAFFELSLNPWTLKNVLEHFVDHYSYEDQVFSPEDPNTLLDGGVSFTHDMGVGNHFSPDKYSCYECAGIDRKCFSYMTYEQLTNWVLCAGLYISKTEDMEFLRNHSSLLESCFESLKNRDNPDPSKRDGLMGYDSSRTMGGGEITTYDSLDHSLGQARKNIYLGGKCWASYLALEKLFKLLDKVTLADSAHAAAILCANTLENAFDEDLGFIPAVLEDGNQSAIIPAVEALIYPHKMGLHETLNPEGEFAGYLSILKKHISNILKPGMCIYDDGGWKLSSSADNSWMSKICLNQYVIHEILKMNYGGEASADNAHVEWEVNGSKSQACSDQFASGKPIGSLYYPRIVTNILWLDAHTMRWS